MDTPPSNMDTLSVNRQIKDGVFRLLFETPENAAELYYALTGIKCALDEIQIITITTTISGKLKNDLAFVVRGRALVVGEHMASPYANMPIRFLMYVGQLYEKWIKMKGEDDFLYRSKPYKIPTPEFIVFYNGAAPKPAKEILKLSSAFEIEHDSSLGSLELEVPVYNINKGMNEELLAKSDKLRQYAEFVAKLKEFNTSYTDFAHAVRQTVNHCIANDILADFLREQGGKIVSILATEYDVEKAKRIYGEELLEDRVAEIVENMLRLGLSKSQISQATGFSVDEIDKIEATLL